MKPHLNPVASSPSTQRAGAVSQTVKTAPAQPFGSGALRPIGPMLFKIVERARP